jgi:hypothetical protein
MTPALLINKSGTPRLDSKRAAHGSTWLSKATSMAPKSCGGRKRSRKFSMMSRFCPQPSTVCPSSMNFSASASPRPRVTPVMTMSLG